MGHLNKHIKILAILLFVSHSSIAQKMREIVIVSDTVQEFNKNPSLVEETYIEDGIKLYTVDSLNKIVSFATYKDNQLNGSYYSFFVDVDMLEQRGEYRANKKHGTWYFWNRKGLLLRTEEWRNDKLISKRIMSKTK